MRKRFILPLLMLVFASAFGWAQANVNESLETAFLYVDGTIGSDSNPGTQQQPLKTIGAAFSTAVSNNRASIGTQINVNPGTYREALVANYSVRDTSFPITLQAVTNGTVILSGATVQTGWTKYVSNSSIYTSNWNYNWSLCPQLTTCPTQQDITLRQELIAVNGTAMTQVLSLAAMQPGTFYVDATGGLVYVWPPSGTNMGTATVEIATEPLLLHILGKSNLVIRGITFQYANSCHNNAAVSVNGNATNVLFDSDNFFWNNAQGLSVSYPATTFTVQNSTANHNGDSGYTGAQTKFGLWKNDVASFNNWKGAQGAYYGCNTSGFHFYLDHDDTVSGVTSAYNLTYGAHWDTDAANLTVSGSTFTGNFLSGLFFEKDEGPITVTTSHSCNQTSPLSGGGVVVRNSEAIALSDSTLDNNLPAQIAVVGTPGGILVTNWETLQVYNLIAQNFTNTNNIIRGTNSNQVVFQNSYLNGSDWTTFQSTLVSDNNTWWNAYNSLTPFVVPTPVDASTVDFAGWQADSGQDRHSNFSAPASDPGAACNAVTPDAADFWLTVDNESVNADSSGIAIYNLALTPLKFSGTVNLTLDGISKVPGLSATLSPTSVTTSGSSVLTVSAASSTIPGTYPITVIGNNGSLTHTVTMSLVVPTTSIRLSTASLTYGSQQQNTSSSPQTFTISNIGRSSIGFTSFTASQSFSQTNTCGTSLGAGKNCTITVTFTPKVVGSVNGTLTIIDADATSPQIVTMSGTGTAVPTVTLSKYSESFGTQGVNTTSATQTVTLTNTGSVTLNITSIVLSGSNASSFAETNTCGSSVAAGATCNLNMTFTPTSTGSKSATVTVNDNTSNGSQAVTITGTGVTVSPTVTLSASSVAFGNQLINVTSATQTVILTNTGTVSLSVSSVKVGGANAGSFSQTNTCGSSVAAGKTCNINVTFSPTSTGSKSGSVTINDNTTNGAQSFTLSGTGTALTLSPTSLSFGSQLIGTKSSTQTITLTNNTNNSVSITSVTISANWTQTNTCGSSLAGSKTCTITVTFSPTAVGSLSGTLTIKDGDPGSPHTASLTGTGTLATLPTVTLSASAVAFGNQQINKTSSAHTVTLTNTSTVLLSITSIALSGTDKSSFSETNTCGSSLLGGAVCNINLTFTPTTSGSKSATVTINDNTSTGSQTIALTGTGTAISLSPTSLNYGSQQVGTSSSSQTVTVTNNSSTSVSITSVTSSSNWTQTNTCGSSLAGNKTCIITVTFSPSTTGSLTGAITLKDSDPASPQTVSLAGTGTSSNAMVSLSSTSVNFGNQKKNTKSPPKTVTLTNTGGSTLDITSITLTGANAGSFIETTTCGSTVVAGGTCNFTLTFEPKSATTKSAVVTIFDNASGGSQTINLSGTGTN